MKESEELYDKARQLTLADIAKSLNLSKTTISRAISGKGRVSEETRMRVQEYIRENNFRPNQIAKSLAESKTFNLGVVLPADANIVEIPFFQSCLLGVCEIAASLDYDVIVTTVTETDMNLLERLINNHKVDGILLTRTLINDMTIDYLKKQHIPFVVVGTIEDEAVIQIDNDHVAGCCELTSLLIRSGYKALTFIGGSQKHIVNTKRYAGFIKAVKEQGLTISDKQVFLDMTNKALIDRAVTLAMEQKTECIVCSDDMICSKVLNKLEVEGYSVPEDVKIASLYNSVYLQSHRPAITALNINAKEIGEEAGRQLIRLIEGAKVTSKKLMNYEIVLKQSTM